MSSEGAAPSSATGQLNSIDTANDSEATEGRAAIGGRALVRIRYCTQCRWLPRASWIAQELLTTFPTELEVTLEPGFGGVFEVELNGASIFSRAERRRFPEPKELKQKLRDVVAPGRSLGHSDEP